MTNDYSESVQAAGRDYKSRVSFYAKNILQDFKNTSFNRRSMQLYFFLYTVVGFVCVVFTFLPLYQLILSLLIVE